MPYPFFTGGLSGDCAACCGGGCDCPACWFCGYGGDDCTVPVCFECDPHAFDGSLGCCNDCAACPGSCDCYGCQLDLDGNGNIDNLDLANYEALCSGCL